MIVPKQNRTYHPVELSNTVLIGLSHLTENDSVFEGIGSYKTSARQLLEIDPFGESNFLHSVQYFVGHVQPRLKCSTLL